MADQLFPENGIEAMNVVVTGGLSFALATLYYYQTKVQNRQRKLMEQQQKIMELDFLPKVIARQVQFSDSDQSTNTVSYDTINVILLNAGTGIATNLHLRCDASVKIDGKFISLDSNNSIVINGDPVTFQPTLSAVSDPNTQVIGQQLMDGGVLIEKERKHLVGYVSLSTQGLYSDDSNTRDISFTQAIKTLEQANAEQINFQITLLYRDVNDNIYAERLQSGIAQVQQGMTLSQSLQPGPGVSGGGRFVPLSQIKQDVSESLPKSRGRP